MIGKLRGIIERIDTDHVLVDVGGVGYLVFASARTLRQLAENEAATLLIETHVREDHIHLYGFATAQEKGWFNLLTTVQGVGVRLALAILGTFNGEELTSIIAAQDKKAMATVSGVGPKLAERIVIELKSSIGKMPGELAIGLASPAKKTTGDAPRVTEDAISALINLGYPRAQAFSAVMKLSNEHKDLDALIRHSLKELAA